MLARGLLLAGLTVGLAAGAARADYPPGPQVTKDGTAVVLQDYASLPLSSRTVGSYPPPIDFTGQLARVNFLRSEPANAPQSSSRFFVDDNNRNLYVLDRTAKTFTPYINFEEVFPKFDNDPGYAGGLVTFAFDPDYANNGKFYTVHTEDPSKSGSAVPTNASLPGLDLSGGYATTAAIDPPAGTVVRQAVLVEWTDTNRNDSTFQGTARELLRVGFNGNIHPMGDLLFDPLAQPGDADYRNLYIAVGDGGAGETAGTTRSIPQRLDALPGKILRITPDVNLRPADELSSNGRYRIPTTGSDPNPFVSVSLSGLKKEIYAYGFRNPHRMSWDPVSNKLIVDDIGLHSWEEVNIVTKGADYGYSEREGDEQLFVGGTNDGKTGSQTSPPTPFPSPDTLTVTGIDAPVTPVYPVAEYSHRDGDAITSGFVYRGSLMPELDGKYIFGDITTGRLFYADLSDMIARDDGDRTTLAAVHELQVVFDSPYDNPDQGAVNRRLFDVVADAYHHKGGNAGSSALPGSAPATSGNDPAGVPYGGGRADIRLALGGDGEIYVLSKSDGMIRELVGVVAPNQPSVTVTATDGTATEAGPTTGTFAVSRTGSTAAALTVNYTVGGSATPGSDYTALSGSVTIPAGAASAPITVTPVDDTAVEPDETVVLTLAPGGGYQVGAPGSATVTIVSDDVAPAAALYPFSEGAGGTTADVSGNGNTGTITAATWTAGKYGQALQFNGSTSFVTVADAASLDIGAAGTVEAWVRLDALNVWHGIVAKGGANALTAHNYGLEVTNGNRVECGIGNGVSANVLDSTTALTAGTLYHLACVWTGTQLQVYVNGTLNTSIAQTMTPAGNTAPLSIGQYGGNADRMKGVVDEVRIYGRALSQGEIQSDMNTPIAPPAPDTVNPTVTITAPAAGATVAGKVAVTAAASDNVGVAGVQFKLDGANLGAEDTAAPYAVDWDTVASTNGTHVLSASARDAAGNQGTATDVTVTVANDKTPPTVPTNLAAVAASSSQIDLSWSASTDNVGVAGYRVTRNGSAVATTTATTFSDTGLAPQTTYTYSVAAFDAAGNTSANSSPVSATTKPPATNGLVAAYRFGEGAGTTTADVSLNGNAGTLVNGAAWTTAGKYGSAINFDGVDDFVRVADSASLDIAGAGTIEAWVKLDTLSRWDGVVAKGDQNVDSSHDYAVQVDKSNRWRCILGNGASAIALRSSSPVAAGQFVHVACVWNGATVQLFVNGVLNVSAAQSLTPAANTSPLYLGQFGGNTHRLDGIVDEVRIYNRALTQAEIQSDMNTPL